LAGPLKAALDIRKEEWPLALSMFAYFFLVISSFWILKPIKKALFIGFYAETGVDFFPIHRTAAQAELIAKVMNMVVAFAAVMVFTWLVRRYRREQLTYIFSAFFMVCYLGYYVVIENAGHWTVWSFYLFGDLFSTLMVATFFAFLNDSVTTDKAKRLYGVIGMGGVLGGVFGSTFVRVWIDRVSMAHWLLICGVIGVGIIVSAGLAGREAGRDPALKPANQGEEKKKPAGNVALEGARLVFGSRYLLSIVAIVGLYEISSTIMDFMFTTTVSHYLTGPEIGRHFSLVFMITNWVSMLVQLLLTSLIMTRFGLTTALFILPAAVFLSSVSFLALPALWVGSLLNTADNGFSYSINQSAKEALYVPTTKDEKYKAKAFIDMFVQRLAKSIAVFVSLLITTLFTDFSTIRWLSLILIGVVFVWSYAVRYAGREFARVSPGGGSER